MRNYIIIFIGVVVISLSSVDLLAQVNAIPINGGYRFKPETKFLPNTRATPTNLTSNNFSESEYCTTPDMDTTEFKQLPWYGNEQYLENLLDSVGYPSPCPTCRVEVGVRYRIPLVFWVYNNNAGTDITPDDREIRDALERVNEDHRVNDTGFRFYIACDGIRRINSDDLVEIGDFEATVNTKIDFRYPNSNFVKGTINIHVVRNVQGMYNPYTDAIFIGRGRLTGNRGTLSHEIGHALGLQHTHLFQAWRDIPLIKKRITEPVDHSRRRISISPFNFGNIRICSETGDGLCDTPADPQLDGDINYQEASAPAPNCVYTGTERDAWGDRYDNPPAGSRPPNPRNLMSYGRDCRTQFTRGQIAVMVHRVERGRYNAFKNGYKSSNVVTDIFEPDNNAAQRGIVVLNTTQLHTFNQSYRRTGSNLNFYLGSDSYSSCDADWVGFNQPANGFIRIETSDSGQPNVADANTEIRLYNVNNLNTPIATNDNGGTGNFSLIQQTLAAGNYAIEVVNRSPDVVGYYNLEVSTCPNLSALSVTGPSALCGSGTFQATNTAGQPITWRTSSNITITSGQNTASVQVRKSGSNGPGWVEAVVGNGVCQATERFATTIGTTVPPPSDIDLIPKGNNRYQLLLVNSQSGVTYTWDVSGNSATIISGQNTDRLTVQLSGNCGDLRVGVSYNDGCGGIGVISRTFSNLCSGGNFVVSPNPANELLTVALVPEETSVAEVQSNTNTTSDAFEINLYDQGQQMIATNTSQDGQAQLDVSGFKTGVYVLHILYQGETYPYSVVIE